MDTILTGGSTEAELVEEALVALRNRLHLDANLITVETNPRSPHHDAEIDLIVHGEPHRYVVECKAFADRRAVAQQVKQQFQGISMPGLFITPYVSREIAAYCREIDLQFIDTHGNAYLKGPGLLVYVAGERHETGLQPVRSSGGMTGAAGLRVAFTLLARLELAAASYREIASKAGVSLGTVSNAIEDLERRGYLVAGGSGKRRLLLEPARLLDEWTLNYPIQLRPKLNGRRYSMPNANWWKEAQLENTGAVWSGEVAANHLTGYLKPVTQTVYVEPAARASWLKAVVTAHRAKPDPNGSLEVLNKFWADGMELRPGIAPFAMVYADLLASLDPRAAETAYSLRKEWTNGKINPV